MAWSWFVVSMALSLPLFAASSVAKEQDPTGPFKRVPLHAPARDPFGFVQIRPQQTVLPAVTSAIAPVVEPTAPASVKPPAVQMTFLGRLWPTPNEPLILALLNDQVLILQPGQDLGQGYVVKAISGQEVSLWNTFMNQPVSWPIPEAPLFEVR